MPSFPTSVFAPPTRSAGQTIQPAHMNDVQDELNAIEGGYLNGTARLNSSGSTLASLDVNGNSSLASSITLGTIPYIFPSSGGSTGNILTCISTSGSTMTLEWRAAAASSTPDAVRVILTSTQNVASSQFTAMRSFATQEFITNSSMHSTTTNSSRITPQSTGVYEARGQIEFTANSTGVRGARILDSSGGVVASVIYPTSTVADNVSVQVAGMKRYDAVGGYLRLEARINGGASTISVSTANTWFEVVKL